LENITIHCTILAAPDFLLGSFIWASILPWKSIAGHMLASSSSQLYPKSPLFNKRIIPVVTLQLFLTLLP
jgi:hypothetical protein